jgi:hypothetical protein
MMNECIGLKSSIQNQPTGSAATCRLPGTDFQTQCFGLNLTIPAVLYCHRLTIAKAGGLPGMYGGRPPKSI